MVFKNRRPSGRRFLLLGLLTAVTTAISLGAHAMTKQPGDIQEAMFGAGCFWGVEKILGQIPGVLETSVGYAGGKVPHPDYDAVCTGKTGHAEVVHLKYDAGRVPYTQLLEVFWKYHDPTTLNRQGPDVGSQYRSIIFTYTPEQDRLARASIRVLDRAKVYPGPIVTEVVPAAPFYIAEDYHQKYLQKNPNGYCSHVLRAPHIGAILREGLAAE